MLTLYHSPHTRASRILWLIAELGIWDQIDIRQVGIRRQDGSGGQDPANPHPEGKVPLLVHDGVEIWESSAIMLYLTDMFPKAGIGPLPGDKLRGRYLSWLAWYGDVVEPVVVCSAAQLSHPMITATFRGMPEMNARLIKALEENPYLVGDSFTAADLLLASVYGWMPKLAPDSKAFADWLERCMARPGMKEMVDYEDKLLAPTS